MKLLSRDEKILNFFSSRNWLNYGSKILKKISKEFLNIGYFGNNNFFFQILYLLIIFLNKIEVHKLLVFCSSVTYYMKILNFSKRSTEQILLRRTYGSCGLTLKVGMPYKIGSNPLKNGLIKTCCHQNFCQLAAQ